MEKHTSEIWMQIVPKKYFLQIHRYDGWFNRHGFDLTFYHEEITKQEFLKRLTISIISCVPDFFKSEFYTK